MYIGVYLYIYVCMCVYVYLSVCLHISFLTRSRKISLFNSNKKKYRQSDFKRSIVIERPFENLLLVLNIFRIRAKSVFCTKLERTAR